MVTRVAFKKVLFQHKLFRDSESIFNINGAVKGFRVFIKKIAKSYFPRYQKYEKNRTGYENFDARFLTRIMIGAFINFIYIAYIACKNILFHIKKVHNYGFVKLMLTTLPFEFIYSREIN